MNELSALQELRPGDVQVWVFSPAALARLSRGPCVPADALDADARPPALRQRFLAGRALLRLCLGRLLQRDGAALRLERGPAGKLRCDGGVEFNLSHADGHLGLAFSLGEPVGLDLELEREGGVDRAVARACFGEAELAALEAAEALGQGQAAFLRAWTRLEARAKLRGAGLGPALPKSEDVVALGYAWIEELQLNSALQGALAMPRAPKRIRVFQTMPVGENAKVLQMSGGAR